MKSELVQPLSRLNNGIFKYEEVDESAVGPAALLEHDWLITGPLPCYLRREPGRSRGDAEVKLQTVKQQYEDALPKTPGNRKANRAELTVCVLQLQRCQHACPGPFPCRLS